MAQAGERSNGFGIDLVLGNYLGQGRSWLARFFGIALSLAKQDICKQNEPLALIKQGLITIKKVA